MKKPNWLNGYVLVAVGIVLVISLIGVVISVSSPDLVEQETTLVSYVQTGKFSYVVYLKPSYLYGPPPQGSPANPSLPLAAIDDIDFTFSFNPMNQSWSGSADIQAVLENPGIWQKKVSLISQSSISGAFTLSFSLNPHQMNDLFDQIEKETGISASPRNLSLVASINSEADQYMQSLPLELDRNLIEIPSDLSQKFPAGAGEFNYTVNRKTTTTLLEAQYPIEIVNNLSFTFNYIADGGSSITGWVDAILENPNVWQKTVVMATPTTGAGNLSLPFVLDLAAIQKQFDDIDSQTGITTSPRVVTLKASMSFGNEKFIQNLRLVMERGVLKVPGNLVLAQAGGRGQFDYVVNLRPNDLYETLILQPPQATSVAGDAGETDYEINLKPTATTPVTAPITLDPGQVAFTKLIDQMDVVFDYEFTSDQPLSGLYTDLQIMALIEAPQIWSKKFVLLNTRKSGNFNVSFPLDIAGYADLLESIRTETGVTPDAYNISVIANLHTTGQTQFGTVDETFSPTMKGTIKGTMLQWDKELTVNDPGAITKTEMAPNPHRLLGMPDDAAIGISGGLTVVFGLLFSLFLALYFRSPRHLLPPYYREVLRIKKKYGQQIIEATSGNAPVGSNVVLISSMPDLIKAANELGKPIIHEASSTPSEPHTYYIADGNIRYVFRPVSRSHEDGRG